MPHRVLVILLALVALVGCSGTGTSRGNAPQSSGPGRAYVWPELWELDASFPGLRPLYERVDPRQSHVMRGYALPGEPADPVLGPMITTDVKPDLRPGMGMREVYETYIHDKDRRPHASTRLLFADANAAVFENRYGGPPSKPDLRFTSIVRISRHPERRVIAFASYIAESAALSDAEAAAIADRLKRITLTGEWNEIRPR